MVGLVLGTSVENDDLQPRWSQERSLVLLAWLLCGNLEAFFRDSSCAVYAHFF